VSSISFVHITNKICIHTSHKNTAERKQMSEGFQTEDKRFHICSHLIQMLGQCGCECTVHMHNIIPVQYIYIMHAWYKFSIATKVQTQHSILYTRSSNKYRF